MNSTSILITTFLRPHLLQWNLFSLAKQKITHPFETIVLNDGLPDETESLCRQYEARLNLKYVFTGQRNIEGSLIYRVPGFALNIGAKIASGENLIISCAEMFHLNNTIENLIDPLQYSSQLMCTAIGMDDDGSFLDYLNLHHGDFDSHAFNYNYATVNTSLPFLMAVRKEKYLAIGGYDEDFTGFAYDDNDFVDRMKLSGCRLALTQAKTIHLYHVRHDLGMEMSPPYLHNQRLYRDRQGLIIRNNGREWGKLTP